VERRLRQTAVGGGTDGDGTRRPAVVHKQGGDGGSVARPGWHTELDGGGMAAQPGWWGRAVDERRDDGLRRQRAVEDGGGGRRRHEDK
jgi:hypothetical protein